MSSSHGPLPVPCPSCGEGPLTVDIPDDSPPVLWCYGCDQAIDVDIASYEAGKLVGARHEADRPPDLTGQPAPNGHSEPDEVIEVISLEPDEDPGFEDEAQ